MPIYEFRCLKCQELFELLVVKTNDQVEMKCPECGAPEFERVMSATNYSMNGGGGGSGPTIGTARTRTCTGGSCTTYDIPGPKG